MKQFIFFLLFLSTVGLPAQTIRYVTENGPTPAGNAVNATSWDVACNDLQAVIEVSNSGDIIWVKKGVYKPIRPANNINSIETDNRNNAFVLKDGVLLYGGFIGNETPGYDISLRNLITNASILTGKISDSPFFNIYTYHTVIAATKTGAESFYVDGFRIVGAASYGYESIIVNDRTIQQMYGSAVYIENGFVNDSEKTHTGGDITFTNCNITGPRIYVNSVVNGKNKGGNIHVSNNTINVTNGIQINSNGENPDFQGTNIYLENNTITSGNGINYNDYFNNKFCYGNILIRNNTFNSNSGGLNIDLNSIGNSSKGKTIIQSNTFKGSDFGTGIALYFSDNYSSFQSNGEIDITSNTFTNFSNGIEISYYFSNSNQYNVKLPIIDINNNMISNCKYNGLVISFQYLPFLFQDTLFLIHNNTIANNKGAGMIFKYTTYRDQRIGETFINNNLVWNNGVNSNLQFSNSFDYFQFNHNLIQGYSANTLNQIGSEGTGNLDSDGITTAQLFVSSTDLHLKAKSPAINKGNNQYVSSEITTDLDWNPRITGSFVDLGAYEYQLVTYLIITQSTHNNSELLIGSGNYDINETVDIKVIPSAYYTFEKWTCNGNFVTNSPNFSFTVTQDSIFKAHFTSQPYQITVKSNLPEGGIVSGEDLYEYGKNVNLMAIPATGYRFVKWTYEGNTVSTKKRYQFTAKKAAEYTAHFIKICHVSIQATPFSGGTVYGAGTYDLGTSVWLYASTSWGYSFEGWYSNGVKTASVLNYYVTFTQDTVFEARFTPIKYSISVSVNPTSGGTVTGSGLFDYETTTTIKAIPASGYRFVNWTQGGSIVSTDAEYSFMVSRSANYTALFVNIYTINTEATPPEGGNVSGTGIYEYENNVDLIATPNPGYIFEGWYWNGQFISNNTNYSFLARSSKVYTAVFSIQSFSVSLSSTLTNSTLSGNGNYIHGTQVTIDAVTPPGYQFTGWKKGSTYISFDASYCFKIEDDMDLIACFELKKITVTLTANTIEGGTYSLTGSTLYGNTVTVNANPAEGYEFVGWTYGWDLISTQNSYAFKITEPINLKANFAPKTYDVILTLNLEKGGNTQYTGSKRHGTQITLAATPAKGYTFVNWTKGDEIISTDSSYTFTITDHINVQANFAPLTGIHTVSKKTPYFLLYPNPVKDILHIETEEHIEYLTLFDVKGRIIKKMQNPSHSISVSDLPYGIYFIQIKTGKGENTKRFIRN